MGQLVDGTWTSKSVLVQHDKTGLYFKRESVFRNRISPQADAEFPAEPGRYHLYCAVACPWAHRATLMRTLKKLEPFVTLTDTFQELGGEGWSFGEEGHIVPGTDRRVRWLHELYTIADPACTTRVTVPTRGTQRRAASSTMNPPSSCECSTPHLRASRSPHRITIPNRCGSRSTPQMRSCSKA